MAATRLIALHINKGKTVAQCLADRTDYSENAAKTEDGKYISAYACDAKTCDEEFLLSKRQYEHITGRTQAHDVIAYQIRQSFKPGEITPEEANKVGYETAMRFTKGKHAFIVATHVLSLIHISHDGRMADYRQEYTEPERCPCLYDLRHQPCQCLPDFRGYAESAGYSYLRYRGGCRR